MVRGLVLLVLALKACTAEFQPVTVYEQTRKSESSGFYPRPRYEEDPNAHRLRESIAVTKVQQVYEEKGYEDGGYDHGHSDEHGRSYEHYKRFPTSRSDALEDSSESSKRVNNPSTRIRNFDSEPTQLEEVIHRKRFTDDFDGDYEEDDEESDEQEYDGEDEHTVEHITVPPSWKEEKKTKNGFDKLANKEIEEFKKNFEKEWKELKISPDVKEELGKLKKTAKGIKPEENKKKVKSARNMKKKDKYNMFKYKPIRVPHTKIQGLGPFRPLVLGNKVIYPGQIAKSRKAYGLWGMDSMVSMATLPYRRLPPPNQPLIKGLQTQQVSFVTSPSNRSPNLVRYYSEVPQIPSFTNTPFGTNLSTRKPVKSQAPPIKSPSSITGFNFQSGFTPIFSSNDDKQQKLKASSIVPSFSSQTVSNFNGKSRGVTKTARGNATFPSSASKENESKPQNLNRGQVKYIERLTTSHYAIPKERQTFKPVPKIKQEQIKDLAKQLNSENKFKEPGRPSSSHTKRFSRTGMSNKKLEHSESKYPFYKQDKTEAFSEDSPLHYIRNPKLRPIKTKKNMVLFSDTQSNPCDDPHFPVDILPKHQKDGEWIGGRNVDGPRAKNVGSDILCLKNKHFGEEPLDNPLFQEIKRKPVDSETIFANSNFNQNFQRVGSKARRTKRDVDLSKYHVVLTRQSRRPTYDYEDDEEIQADAKTEETSHAETSTIAITTVSQTTRPSPKKIEETISSVEEASTIPSIRHKVRSTTEKPAFTTSESGEESLEKLITVMTRPVKRVHRPRHAYSSRYSSTRKIYSTIKPKTTTTEEPSTTERTTTYTQSRHEPEPTEEGKSENKKILLKQRIKFMTARPVKFSLLPGNNQESTERLRTTTTTTEEPSSTSETPSSSTTRMYPPKRKILKLRKGPFNIFSVLNDGKSSTTKFPLMDYYSEAKMSSSENVETYEEPNSPSSEVITVDHVTKEPPRRIKIRRPATLHLREKKSSGEETPLDTISSAESKIETRSGEKDKKKISNSKKERAVEVEFHQVLVQKVDPIDELSAVTPPMMTDFAPSSSTSPLGQSDSLAAIKAKTSDDINTYSVPETSTWKKYKQEKIVRGKLRKRTDVRTTTTTPDSPPEGNESRVYERLEQHQDNDDLYKRRRRPTTAKPYFLPTSLYENDDQQNPLNQNQAHVVGLMTQVIPKEINSLGLPTAQIPLDLDISSEIGDDGRFIQPSEYVEDKHGISPIIHSYADDIVPRPPVVISSTTTTESPRWKQEPVRSRGDGVRRRPPAEPVASVVSVPEVTQHRRKPIRLTLTSTEVPEEKITPAKKQTRWRKPTSVTPESSFSHEDVPEEPRWKGEELIDEPLWNPRVSDDTKDVSRDEWTQTVTTQEPPKWKPVTIPEPIPWKSGQGTEKPRWKTINFEPTTENGKSLSSYYEGEDIREEVDENPAPVYETDSELTFNFELDEPTLPIQSESIKPLANDGHSLSVDVDQVNWKIPSHREEVKPSVQYGESPSSTPAYEHESVTRAQTEPSRRRRPSYNDESVHKTQTEHPKRRRPNYNEEPKQHTRAEQSKRRRPTYNEEPKITQENDRPQWNSQPLNEEIKPTKEYSQPSWINPTYNEGPAVQVPTEQPENPKRRRPTYSEEPTSTEQTQFSQWNGDPHSEDIQPAKDYEQPPWVYPTYNEESVIQVSTEQPQRSKPKFDEEPKPTVQTQQPQWNSQPYTAEIDPTKDYDQPAWVNPSYIDESAVPISTEQPKRRRPSYNEAPRSTEQTRQSQWRRPSFTPEPTLYTQTESPQPSIPQPLIPVFEEEPLVPEPGYRLSPTLLPTYSKYEEQSPHTYDENFNVNSNHNTETKTEVADDATTEQPKKRKPMHIIRKPKPKTETDELDNIKSPAFQLDTMEKRRRVQLKTKTDDNEKQDAQLDETGMMRRRKQFLKNLLRPSIERHKTPEQPDAHVAESNAKWIKDPRQRSYFYVND